MSNPFFQFKQFVIYQDRCAMKVCTDACLFGAWAAKQFEKIEAGNILDIGTGTGLLSLMLAQKLSGKIETIEIDRDAYEQAIGNVSATKWKNRLLVINNDVRSYHFTHSYDLIVSNPPFYENDLRSPDTASNKARHDETLTLEDLLAVAAVNLAENGSFTLLIPYHRLDYFKGLAARFDLVPSYIVNVRQSAQHSHFRSMIVLKRSMAFIIEEKELAIKEANNYTAEFINLLKDYYLRL